MPDIYPSNSFNKPEPKKDEKKIEKVVQGNVVPRKKTLGEKISETFLVSDMESVAEHGIFDVLIPAFKATLADIVTGTVNMLLFGERKGDRTRRDGGRSYVSYERYYDRDNRSERREAPRSKNMVDDLIFETRGEAEEVLSNVADLIDEYGSASVKDLYGYAGLSTDYTKDRWGWFSVRDARVIRVREGYLLEMPKPVVID